MSIIIPHLQSMVISNVAMVITSVVLVPNFNTKNNVDIMCQKDPDYLFILNVSSAAVKQTAAWELGVCDVLCHVSMESSVLC